MILVLHNITVLFILLYIFYIISLGFHISSLLQCEKDVFYTN